ncbi:MAG: DNA-binding transcriptional regulator Fis [Gammaproteobacteria bacterium]|jgi:Fis family transcriptional regulator|nr:DNA-binding transcriptional regulator Fis [Gammaproteobacteria bacterium]MDP7456176.1 DNA-binding transcriptional regulator Fis [Gammaproteobacteria bacterium]HJO10931.1 DNA-binding transcriptional regulator Fis [Gammaproteobacteria bacterium]|tara:strand:+ start:223 stop:525 length:303 start_codon:yes stop_codon:yes gene_type:complete
MNKLDDTVVQAQFQIADQLDSTNLQESTLREEVEKALRRYFQHLEDEPVTDLYQMVISEVEAPLLEAVMRYTGNNQSKASIMLGLNRGTLRTKLKQYNLL